ncbi:MAG: tetratricopeptide repeat protein [Acidobacteriota bacterium]|nr:tetratricopeptide repeat protein [Acidobacteriota bacterium]
MIGSPHETAARERLAAIVESDKPLDIVEAALVVAAGEYPHLSVADERRRIDDLGVEAARRLDGLSNPFARLDALRVFLFEERGFRGNSEDYHDPRNSYLNDVLDRGLGIPLTLSIVTMETARRCGYRARGVGLPGHFVVGLELDGRGHLLDPFNGGALITEEDCRELVTRSTGKPHLYSPELLQGASTDAMLVRLLGNLKRVFLGREEWSRALSVVEMLRVVRPDEPAELRDRGFLLARLGRPGAALGDLETYLALAPDAADASAVRSRLGWLRRRVTEIN